MFCFNLFVFIIFTGAVCSNQSYNPRNIPHDNLNDDMNNVGEGWREGGGLEWDEIFAEEYEDKKTKEEEEADLDATAGKDHSPVRVVEGWSPRQLPIGQVAGLAVDSNGLLHVLHRAGRIWGPGLFDQRYNYIGDRRRIGENTVMVVNGSDGRVVEEWGQNLFTLPHGLQIDSNDDVFITDVALHQVFQFKRGQRDPVLELGTAYEPAVSNEDLDKFCQPTDVATASLGAFYVADGYCNSRIMRYGGGHRGVEGVFGKGDSDIPHSVVLLEQADMLCVADREGMRVLCYNAGLQDILKLGERVNQYFHQRIGPIYAITYNHNDSLIYGVAWGMGEVRATGFTLDVLELPQYSSDFILWPSSSEEEEEEEEEEEVHHHDHVQDLKNPHDICSFGMSLYVGEVGPGVIWKFEKVQ